MASAVTLKFTVQPLQDRVLVKRDDAPKTTKGGIVIPETARDPLGAAAGTVLAVSKRPRRKSDGPGVKTGDHVLFAHHAGVPVERDGVRYLLLSENELLAVVRPA